jgi:DNA-binding protein H-NS
VFCLLNTRNQTQRLVDKRADAVRRWDGCCDSALSFGLLRPLKRLGGAAFENDKSSEMKPFDLKSMSVDELWSLHQLVVAALPRKIQTKTEKLNQRLRQLALSPSHNEKKGHARPKYRNPAEPLETWAGRGKMPRWLTAQLKSGKKIDDFRID